MKKYLSLVSVITIVITMICMLPVHSFAATEYTSGDYAYRIVGEEATISKYNGTSRTVTIPDFLDGYPVKGIGEWAFRYCSWIQEIVIPDSVTAIGSSAFAFCSSLKDVTLPSELVQIGNYAFEGCVEFESITIPRNVTSVSSLAFKGCTGLTSIAVDKDNTKYYSEGNCLIKKDDQTLLYGCMTSVIPNCVTKIKSEAFSGCVGLEKITIPNSVKEIGRAAFSDCTGLESIAIPESVTNIDNAAFSGCTGLTSVIISNGITSINYSLFSGCTELEEIVIPSTVVTIDENAFLNCSGLTSITIPNSVTSVGKSAFSGCSKLNSVVIPNSVINIGESAFFGCAGMTSIVFSNSVQYIGETVLGGCDKLVGITVEDDNPNYYSEGNCLIERSSKTLLLGCKASTIPSDVLSIGNCAFYNCTELTNITIPNGVQKIDDCAFRGCTKLESIMIPGSVNNIGWSAFCDCTNLTTVSIQEGVTGIGSYAFSKCDNLLSITIPSSITNINDNACGFSGGPINIYYGGSEEQWNDPNWIRIGSGNNWCNSAKIYFNSNGPSATTETEITTDNETTTTENSQPEAHTISVSLGSADKATAYESEIVTVTADAPAQGLVFDKWVGEGVTFADETATETTFTMPDNDVSISATYKLASYAISVTGGSADKETAAVGSLVMVTADVPSGYVFDKWTSEDVTFADETMAETTFVMPASAVTIEATFKEIASTTETEKTSSTSIPTQSESGSQTSASQMPSETSSTSKTVVYTFVDQNGDTVVVYSDGSSEVIPKSTTSQKEITATYVDADGNTVIVYSDGTVEVIPKSTETGSKTNSTGIGSKTNPSETGTNTTDNALDVAKEAAKAALDKAAGENLSDKMKTILEDAKAKINQAKTVDDVNAAKEFGLAVIAEQIARETSATTETLYGDANGDDAVNMKDVLTLRKYLADMPVSINLDASDVNADGTVNMKDVLMLRKYLADMIDKLGA